MADTLLVALLAVPLVTTLVLAVRASRLAALAGALATVVVAALLVREVALGTVPAIARWGLVLRLDAPSALVALVVALVGVAALVVQAFPATARGEASRSLALPTLSLAGHLGTVVAADVVSLAVWPAVALVPLAVLTARHGGHRRDPAALQGLLAATVGTALTLAGFALLSADRLPHEPFALDLAGLTARAAERVGASALPLAAPLAFWLVLGGLALRAAIPPLHTWSPFLHEEAPTSVTMLLGGPHTAVLGLVVVRTLPLFPAPFTRHGGLLASVLVVAAAHAALVSLAQRDLRRFAAYASSTTLAFALFAAAAGTPQALDAGWFLFASLALGGALLCGVAGVLAERAGHRHVDSFGGLAQRTPQLALLGAAGMLSLSGLPGLAPFAGTVLATFGALPVRPARTLGALGVLLVLAAAATWTFHRVFLGPPNERHRTLADATRAERLALWPLAIALVVLGVVPGLVTSFVHETALGVSELLLRR